MRLLPANTWLYVTLSSTEFFIQVNNTWWLSSLCAHSIFRVNLLSSLSRFSAHLNSYLLSLYLCVRLCCRFLGVPPGRGSCPLTGPLPFDLIYTDYHGLQQMKQHMGLSLKKHKLVDVHCVWVCVALFSHSVCVWYFLYFYVSLCQQLSRRVGLDVFMD